MDGRPCKAWTRLHPEQQMLDVCREGQVLVQNEGQELAWQRLRAGSQSREMASEEQARPPSLLALSLSVIPETPW